MLLSTHRPQSALSLVKSSHRRNFGETTFFRRNSFASLELWKVVSPVMLTPPPPTPLPPYCSIRYRCVFVRTNSAFPATAGDAMQPASK
jgi:hypothetical protein